MSTSLPLNGLVSRELAVIRRRTRHFFYASVAAHIVLFFGWALYHIVTPDEPRLVEITWLSPEVPPGVPLPAAAAAPAEEKENRSFVRETKRGDIAPLEQDPDAVADRMVQRLASMQENDSNRRAPLSALVDREERPALRLPGIPGVSDAQATPAQLVRNGTRAEPTPLSRTEAKQAPPPVLSRLPEEKEAPKPKPVPEPKAKRDIAGASLVGPVADRRLVSYETPSYPDKARREAIEGSVKLYFTVLPDGRVKENIMIEKTSGFDGFDRNAVAALRAWRFEPMKSGSTGEQWGSITFHYRLSDRT